MEEVVLSDDLVIALSKKINITLYPVSHFAVDLGFDSAAASVAEELAIQKQHPHGKYEYLLHKFVATHGRGVKAAQVLIDIFKVKQKMLLVNFLKEAIEKQNALKQSGRRQEPGHAEGQGQSGTEIRPSNAGTSARDLRPSRSQIDWSVSEPCSQNTLQPSEQTPSPVNQPAPAEDIFSRNKSFSKFVAGLSLIGLIVAFLAIVMACNWNNPPTELIAETFSLEECQDTLRKHYEKHLFNVRIKPWDPYYDVDLETLYTTVSLYKQDKNNIPDESLQKSTLNGSVNDIFHTKVRGSLPERIVLFGEAGRGKTTAVAKMAYDWANKKEDSPLKNVKLLFVFKMRNINAKTGITEAIITLLGKKYKKYKKQLEDYIDSHEKDIVMLFDGYDEFSGGLEKCMQNVSENVGDVIDILCQERCRQCRVLVTSRPVRKEDFYSRKLYYSMMVIEGYSQQHAIDFIDKFFLSNKKKGTELKKYLEEDIVTNEMIATPLFCTMVCTLWNHGYMNGNYTRTKLFDDIMKFLRTHLNAKDERDKEIKQDLLSDTLVSVGRVAYMKLSNNIDLNPLVFSEDDFSEVHDDKVNISFSLGLLTKNMKTDSDVIIHIEFFHKLAQEYSAGKYLASGLDDGQISIVGLSKVVFDLKEIFLFASGTSVLACQNILASLMAGYSSSFSHKDELYKYRQIILDFVSEAGTNCAEESETHLTRFFEDGKLGLQEVTASTVVGFEKLPRSVKEKITSIDISETTSSPDLFVRLWNSMQTCIHLTHMEMNRHGPPTISPQMEPLYSVNSFTALRAPADDYVQIMMYLPNLRELIISCLGYDDFAECSLTPDVFGRLWNQVNSSSLLSRLVLPIPANISFNLKHLTSIRVFETNRVISVSSLAHVLTFLPKVRELNIYANELVQLDNSTEACELWKNFHTSPDLYQIRILRLFSRNIPCDLEPLRSVQEFSILSSIHLPIILINLPNLKILEIFFDIHGFVDVWGVLHILHELHRLAMFVPETVPVSLLEPLWSVQTFETHIPSNVEAFPILLTRLPNVSELFVLATNNNDRKIAEDTYFDKVISAIIDGLVKNGVQLKVLNMTFGPYLDPSKTVSRDTVENFIKMLKTSGMMLQLQIISIDYCVFNESDLIEIIKSIREFTSIMILRIDCCLHSEGEVTRFAIQQDQPQEENQDINKSEQSGSLMLTLFYKDKFFCYVSVCGERRGTGAHPSNDKNKREEKYLLREMFFLLPKYVKLNDFSI